MKPEHNIQVVPFKSKLDGLITYLGNNGNPGLYIGFSCLNQYYTHKDAGCTDWTGFAASGKSYFVLEILMTLSEKYGHRHALYVPDIGSYEEVWSKLFMMRTGKNFNGIFGNKATEQDILHHENWINFHFLILQRIDIKKPVKPDDIWLFTCEYKDDEGGVQTCLIDSWKNLYHEYQGREDLYLDYILSLRNDLAEGYNKHFHTIAHSTKTEIDESLTVTDPETKKSKKKRRVPDANDIKGGGSWFANGKNIITVDYPDKNTNAIDIHVSKTKPEGIGRVGSIVGKIKLDMNRKRFYEEIQIGNNFEKSFTFNTVPF